MGMIGLSAYMMPKARIRVFFWYIFMWKTLYVRAWVLAAIYIGLDTWTMFSVADYGSTNVVAHVAGGFAGYLYGHFWLRERREDIMPLAQHFARFYCSQNGTPNARFSDEAEVRLQEWNWPGNVRELENAIHRAVILVDGGVIEPETIRRFKLNLIGKRLVRTEGGEAAEEKET